MWNYKCHFWSLDVHNWVWYIQSNNYWWYLVAPSCQCRVMWSTKNCKGNIEWDNELLFTQYQLTKKILTYVKEEGNNLNILASALLQMVDCEPLQLHVLGMPWTRHFNMLPQMIKCAREWHMSLKIAQSTLQKTITWTKFFWQRLPRVGEGL